MRFTLAILLLLTHPLLAQDAPVAGFGGTGPLLGVAPRIAPPPYKLRWKYQAGEGDRRPGIENNPTIAGDTVYVADANGALHVLNLADGTRKWQYTSRGGFATTPLVVDGKVLLGDLDGVFHCIDAKTGAKVWTTDTDSPIHASANISPDRTTLYFANDGAEIFALTLADGKQRWKATSGDRVNSCPAVARGLVMIAGCDANLMAFDQASGKEAFVLDLKALAPGSPAILDDKIIVGTGDGAVLGISPDGKEIRWTYDKAEEKGAMFTSSPAVADGIVVIGCEDRVVHGINAADGKQAWKFKTRGEVEATPVISDGRVYVGSKDKKFYVLDLKTGKKLWEATASRAITAGPAIAAGVLVFGDTAGNVYCYEKAE